MQKPPSSSGVLSPLEIVYCMSCFCHAMQHPEAIFILRGAPAHSQGPKEQRDNAGTGQEVRSQEEHGGVYARLSPLTIWVGT